MAHNLQVGTTARYVSGEFDYVLTGGDALYYGDQPGVSVSSNIGTLAVGERISRASNSYIVSAGTSYVNQVSRSTPGGVDIINPADGTTPTYDSTLKRFTLKAPGTEFNVRDYGAVGDGVTDDRAAIQTAIDTAEAAGGGIVYLPSGNYYLGSMASSLALVLPQDSSGITIRGAGQKATMITLSTACHRAFDMKSTADDQTFQNIAVEDLTVDGDSVTPATSSHGVIGNLVGGAWGQRVNFYNIRISRVNTINFATEVDISDPVRQTISLVSTQSATGQATNTISKILVEDCDFDGGNSGVVVAGHPTGTAGARNVYIDDVRIERVTHDTGVTPTAFFTASNFQVGSYGYGGSVSIRDCIGKRSGDVGIEFNGVDFATATGCRIEDAEEASFYCRNFRTPNRPEAQVIAWDDCHAVYNLIDPSTTVSCVGFQVSSTDATTESPLSVVIRDCSVHTNTAMSGGATAGRGIRAQNVALRRLTVERFTYTAPNAALAPGSANTPSVIYVRASASARVSLKDVLLKMTGTVNSNVELRGIWLSGIQTIDLEGIDIDFQVTGVSAGKLSVLTLGADTGSIMGGSVRGLRIINDTDSTAPYAVSVSATSLLSIPAPIVFDSCDFVGCAAGVVGSGFHFGDAPQRPNCIIKNHKGVSTGTVASADPTTIPEGLEFVTLSGTATVNSITRSWAGHRLTLLASAAWTLTDGSNLNLAGNFTAGADDTITLVCDGTNWNEIGRSVN